MNTATPVLPSCYAPAAVLERKIHDIEYFKSKSTVTEAEVRTYAAENGLTFDEKRLKLALNFNGISEPTNFSYMVASLRRGERAYPATIVQRFAKKHRLPVDRETERFLKERAKAEKAEHEQQGKSVWTISYLKRMMVAGENSTQEKKPYSEETIRKHATKYGLPLDESRLRSIFNP